MKYGSDDEVKRLLDSGADVKAWSDNGYTALHYAAEAGRTSVVEALLAKGADIDAVGKIAADTPLYFAAINGHTDTVQLLLDKGAKQKVKGASDHRPGTLPRQRARRKL